MINNPEKYTLQCRKNVKAFYNRNKEMIREKNLARYRFGIEFFSFIKIYNNLNEKDNEDIIWISENLIMMTDSTPYWVNYKGFF